MYALKVPRFCLNSQPLSRHGSPKNMKNAFVMARVSPPILLAILLFTVLASGQTNTPGAPSFPPSANQAAAADGFDVTAAVKTYLAKMPPAQRAHSDAYF